MFGGTHRLASAPGYGTTVTVRCRHDQEAGNVT
jgi:hypothetical protein